ncbi:O-antigen ligase family protein [Yokenella regensburgei]|uniref:O-antigen ligase family protein n=1 Tax=Yokenella regensburgei TaxID=158877 RepID=UPI0031DFF265
MQTLKNSYSSGLLFFLTFITMLASQYFMFYDAVHSRKFFYTAGYIAIVLALFSARKIIASRQNGIPTLGILILALTFLIWLSVFKQKGSFDDVYNAYDTSGRILLLLALLVFIFSNIKLPRYPLLLDGIFIAGGLLVNLYAAWQYHVSATERVDLGFDRATIAAYIITVIDIFMVYAVLNRHGWVRYILFAATIALTYSVLIFTGTRSALLSYPILCLLLAFTHPKVNKQHLLKMLFCLAGLLIIAGYLLKKPIEQRISSLTHDLYAIQVNNNNLTSVGSRIVMFQVGLDTGMTAPWGESVESRSREIEAAVQHDPALQGALTFIDVHLHNEIIENFSLRGIFGVLALLFMHASLLWCAWKQRNPVLMVITLSLMTYGMSDVIFFSREASIAYAIGILSAIILFKREDEAPVASGIT